MSRRPSPAGMTPGAAPGAALVLAALILGLATCKSVDFVAREGTEIAISANPLEIAVTGASSQITAQLIEDSGIPVADGTVVTFTTTLGSITPEDETEDGIARAVLSSTGDGGTATVTAFSGGAAPASVEVMVGRTATGIALTATPANLPPGGGTVDLSATVFGQNGAPVSGASVVFSSTQGTLASAGRPVVTDSSGRATDRLTTSTTTEVTATSGAQTQSITVPVGTTGIVALVLSADRVSLPSSGGTVNLVAVVLGDSGPIPDVAVAWTASAGSLANPGVTFTDSFGQTENRLTTSVTTDVTVAAGSQTATLQVTVGAGTTTATVAVGAQRSSIPPASSPAGSCATPGSIFPIRVFAQVTDTNGSAIPGRDVLFFVDFFELSDCGRSFGEFCGSGSQVITDTTDGNGVAEVFYTMTQADFDFCNCLPSGCNCVSDPLVDCDPVTAGMQVGRGFCPTTSLCAASASCRVTPSAEDLFCQVPIKAVSGGVLSDSTQFIEYGL